MTKRVLEFTCGDPKSNQQTASKVDCNITINNTTPNGSTKSASKPQQRNITVEDGSDDIQVYNNPDQENELEDLSEIDNQNNSGISKINSSLKVKIPVNRGINDAPQNSDRYVVTSRNQIVLREELLASNAVKDTLIDILTTLLIHHNRQLLANIIDMSNKVILKASDFSRLVASMLSVGGTEVKPGDIKIRYNEDIETSCRKVIVSPFKRVVNIQVNDQDLKLHQYEVYNVLTNDFRISAETIYMPEGSK